MGGDRAFGSLQKPSIAMVPLCIKLKGKKTIGQDPSHITNDVPTPTVLGRRCRINYY